MLDFDTALQDVSRAFRTPRDIMIADLSPQQKDRLLGQWEYDLRSLQVGEDESMTSTRPGATATLLQEVKDCRIELGLDRPSERTGTPASSHGA